MAEKYNILIVDDDADDRDILIDILTSIDSNIICTTAQNGEEALAILKNNHPLPDVIFIDLNMPRIDGKRFLQEKNKIAELSSIPAIVHSTSGLSRDIEDVKKLGAFAFVVKASRYLLLCAEIRRVWEEIKAKILLT